MDSVRKAKERLRNYPLLLTKCADKATAYATCVTRDFNVRQHICNEEFQAFKLCLLKAAKEMKTKL